MNKFKSVVKNSLFREFSLYSFSTFLFQLSRVLVELTAAKILGPALWGVWYFLNLVLVYRSFAYMGIVNGMNREVPIKLGSKNKAEADKLKNITFSVVLISSVLASVLILLLPLFLELGELTRSVYSLIPLFFATQFYYLISTTLCAEALFNKVSQMQIIVAVSFPIVAIPLTLNFGLEGFILGFSFSLCFAIIYAYFGRLVTYRFDINYEKIKELVRIGFPIMLVGIAYALLSTADRWIIGLFIGSEALGFYSMAIIVFSTISLLPRVISQQLYPRMAFDWGKSNSREDLKKWSDLQTKYTAYMIVPILAGVYLLAPKLITWFLPEYQAGIMAIQIIIFGAVFKPFSAGWGNVLNIIDKQVYYLGVIITAVILNLAVNALMVYYGYGINGVAFGTALTFALYNLSIMFVGKYFLNRV